MGHIRTSDCNRKENPELKRATLLIVVVMLLSLLMIPKAAASDGWLSGWTYRESHTINGAEGAGADYQVKLKTMYGSTVVANYSSTADYTGGWANAWDSSNNNYLIVSKASTYVLFKSTDMGNTYSLKWTPPNGGSLFRYFIFVSWLSSSLNQSST